AHVLGPAVKAGRTPVQLGPGRPGVHTIEGQVLGTRAYMAPEQAAGRSDLVDRHTDVYGLGAMLYEILSGRPPFAGSDKMEVLRQVREETPPRPRQLWPAVPPALEAVCLQALAPQPSAPYASAADLARDVQRWLADEPVSAYREPLPARLGRWARRNKAIVASAAALLVTAVVGLTVGIVLLDQEKQRTEEAKVKAEFNEANAKAQKKKADEESERAERKAT